MKPVVHFEMPYDDGTRMVKFYESAFAGRCRCLVRTWAITSWQPPPKRTRAAPKSLVRSMEAFSRKKPDWPAQYPSVVIAVDDVKESMKKVLEAGGKVIGEPMDIPGVGKYVSFSDTEGNRVGMLQPIPRNWHG